MDNYTTYTGSNFIDEQKITSGQKIFNSLHNTKITSAIKTENMFYVHYNINEQINNIISSRNELSSMLSQFSSQQENIINGSTLKELSWELSKLTKSIDKPSIKYTTKQFNEYNRKRIILEKREYEAINITFYSIQNNPVEQFLFNYLKIIDDTFLNKNSKNYQKQISTNFDDGETSWGLNVNSNFKIIDSISIIEMCIDKIIVYTLENPVITSMKFGTNTTGSYKANEITISVEYEGITNNLLVGEQGNVVSPYNNSYLSSTMNYQNMLNSNIDESLALFIQKILVTKNSNFSSNISNNNAQLPNILEKTEHLIHKNKTPTQEINQNVMGKLIYNVIDKNVYTPQGYYNTLQSSTKTVSTQLIKKLSKLF